MTGEVARVHDELRRAYDGDAWHGPPLREALAGVTPEAAAYRHPAVAHSIGGIVRHLSAWVEVVVLRVAEKRAIEVPEGGNFPPAPDATAEAWAAVLGELDRQHRRLLEVVAALRVSDLDGPVAGKGYEAARMLHGTAQHYAYHAGQVALLRKLAAGEPAAPTRVG